MMTVTIIADHDTHLLVTDQSRYAVIERRNNHFYNCRDGKRHGVPADDLSAIEQILDADDWTDEKTAKTTFDDVVARGTDLAQRML